MEILFDSQIFTWQRFGGISRYFYELIKNLESENVGYCMPLCLSNNYYISNKNIFSHSSFFPHIQFRGKVRIMRIVNRLSFYLAAQRKFDIMHPTYYDPYFLKDIGEKPFVLTVHDMIHEKFADFFPNDPTSENKRLLCDKAIKIIAISENTKRDLIEIFGIEPEKIEVIYHGYTVEPNVESLNISLPEKYLLFVGDRVGYKNFSRLYDAFSFLRSENKDLHLICTGKPFTVAESNMFKRDDTLDSIHHFSADDVMLSHLYRHAVVFVFPSLYEGFGIPILEAFACGCPIALSNTSCFPEIALHAGTYFDPTESKEIVAAIHKLINDEEYRHEKIELGYARVKEFSWQKMAQQTVKLYSALRS